MYFLMYFSSVFNIIESFYIWIINKTHGDVKHYKKSLNIDNMIKVMRSDSKYIKYDQKQYFSIIYIYFQTVMITTSLYL